MWADSPAVSDPVIESKPDPHHQVVVPAADMDAGVATSCLSLATRRASALMRHRALSRSRRATKRIPSDQPVHLARVRFAAAQSTGELAAHLGRHGSGQTGDSLAALPASGADNTRRAVTLLAYWVAWSRSCA